MRKYTLAFLAALVALGISSSSASAYVTSVVTVTETSHNEQHASAGTFIKFRILSYIKAKGLTKKEVRGAEKCMMIGKGTKVPKYTNSGRSASGGFTKFEDTDREKACRINGQWRLVRCGNFVWFKILPRIFHGRVLLVRTFAQKKIHIRIPLRVRVPSPCGGPPAEAAAYINQWVRLRVKVKARGNVRIRISGKILDRVKGHVRAGATCEHTTTVITEENPPCTNCNPPCHNCEPPDHKPQISCVFPPHIYVGGSQQMWCEASDSDGDKVDVNVKGDSHVQASSTIPVNERWDSSPCPSGVKCYRTTLWGKSQGTATITATVTANGKSAQVVGTFAVEADEF